MGREGWVVRRGEGGCRCRVLVWEGLGKREIRVWMCRLDRYDRLRRER